MWENEAKNVSQGTKRPQFSWQTVNPPVPHSSPYNIKALSLNYELTNYVLTTRQESKRVKREKTVGWRWLDTKKKYHKKSKNSDWVCTRHCFPKNHHHPTKSNCRTKLCLKTFHLSDLFNIATFERSPMRPASVNIINRLKLKFVSHLISNKVPAAHLFRKPASEWFSKNLLKKSSHSFL